MRQCEGKDNQSKNDIVFVTEIVITKNIIYTIFHFLIMQAYKQKKQQTQSQPQSQPTNIANTKNTFQTAKTLKLTVIQNHKDLNQYQLNKQKLLATKIPETSKEDDNKSSDGDTTQTFIFIKDKIQEMKGKQKLDAAKQQFISVNRESEKIYQNSQQVSNANQMIVKEKKDQAMKFAKMTRQEYNNALKKAKDQFQKQFKDKRIYPKEIYAIDYRLAKQQKQITLKENFKIYFPYQPYQIQLNYMKKIMVTLQNKNNAIIQSPTGTGKTICLLSSVLSFVQKQYKENFNKIKIVYMSRTHSQLSQIQKQLEKTCYRPNMVVFGSRQQLCIKQQLKFLKGKEKIQACGKAVKLSGKYRGMKRNQSNQIDLKIQQTICKYYVQKQEVLAIQRQQLSNKLLNIGLMRQLGEELNFCPYFYPSDVKHLSTLFIMPYNYLLDVYLMPNYKQIIQDSIIIFDEAHNVSEAACQGRSMEVETSTLETAILELNKILSINVSHDLQAIKQKKEKEIKYILSKLQNLRQTFKQFIKQNLFTNQSSYHQKFREEIQSKMINKQKTDLMIFQLFYGPPNDERRREFQSRKQFYQKQMKNKILSPLQQFFQYGVELIEDLKQTIDGKSMNFERVVIFCKKVHDLLKPFVYNINHNKDEHEINHYRLNISKKNSTINNSFTYNIGLTCLMPFLTFQDLQKYKPRSIILTSGTLKPLQTWEKQLQLTFKQQLVNKHVINSEQLLARIITSGISGSLLNFSYENLNKNKDKVFKDLIDFVIQISKRVPNGIFLVFPSFKIQSDFKFYLNKSPRRQQLFSYKDIIYEQKGVDFDLKNFKKKAQSKRGAILMIICRGKVSQGIDLPDGLCRSVIMVGIPWANVRDPFIIEKKNHLQDLYAKSANKNEALRGNQWYAIGTIRTINQALGRVIRHALDYGSIFLVDSRYSQKRFIQQFPSWVCQSLQTVQKVNSNLFSQIQNFQKYKNQKYKPKRLSNNQEQEWMSGKQEKPKNAFEELMKGKNKNKNNGNEYRRRKRESSNSYLGFDF